MGKKQKKARKRERKREREQEREQERELMIELERQKEEKYQGQKKEKRKRRQDNRQASYAETILLKIVLTFVFTIIIILVGTNFIFMTRHADDNLFDKLYPVNFDNDVYSNWPFVPLDIDLGFLDKIINQGDYIISELTRLFPMLLSVFPRLPNYSQWLADTMRITYITNRLLLRMAYEQFAKEKCEKDTFPKILLFLVGCVEFVFFTIFLIPISFFLNLCYSSVMANWVAFALGGFFPAFFIAIFNAFYFYINYIYSSIIGTFVKEKEECRKIITSMKLDLVIIFLWVSVITILSVDSVMIPTDIATIILLIVFATTVIRYAHAFYLWYYFD